MSFERLSQSVVVVFTVLGGWQPGQRNLLPIPFVWDELFMLFIVRV